MTASASGSPRPFEAADGGGRGERETGPMQWRVSDRLRRLIRSGAIRPGERLLEVRVAQAFGVSRSPARAALAMLSREGLLRKVDGRGFVVAGSSPLAADPPQGLASLPGDFPIEPAPRWERILVEVERALSSHALFGAVRITEERLAACFGVSRTVARDVLVRMQAIGLLDKDRLGRWVAERLTPERIRDLYEVRWLLEPQALCHSASGIDPGRLRQMREALVSTLANMPAVDSPMLDRLEHDLHVELLAGCRNREILRALEATRVLLVSNRYLFDLFLGIPVEVIAGSLREHLEVLDALLAGNARQAAAALEAHLRASCGHWLERLERVRPMSHPPFPPYLSALADR